MLTDTNDRDIFLDMMGSVKIGAPKLGTHKNLLDHMMLMTCNEIVLFCITWFTSINLKKLLCAKHGIKHNVKSGFGVMQWKKAKTYLNENIMPGRLILKDIELNTFKNLKTFYTK